MAQKAPATIPSEPLQSDLDHMPQHTQLVDIGCLSVFPIYQVLSHTGPLSIAPTVASIWNSLPPTQFSGIQ